VDQNDLVLGRRVFATHSSHQDVNEKLSAPDVSENNISPNQLKNVKTLRSVKYSPSPPDFLGISKFRTKGPIKQAHLLRLQVAAKVRSNGCFWAPTFWMSSAKNEGCAQFIPPFHEIDASRRLPHKLAIRLEN
jgi:hypothetical protein